MATTFDPSTLPGGGLVVLSNGNLTATFTGGGGNHAILGTTSKTSGKVYLEYTNNQSDGFHPGAGVSNAAGNSDGFVGQSANGIGDFCIGSIYYNGGILGSTGSWSTAGNILGCAFDFTNHLCWFTTDGSTWNGGGGSPGAGTGGLSFTSLGTTFPAWAGATTGDSSTINPGPTMAYTVPAGFTTWDTGGGAFTASLSESGSAADTVTVTKAISASLSESGTGADTVTVVKAISASLAESGTAVDTVSAAEAGSVSLAESVTAIDTVSSSGQYNASLAESGSGSDTVAISADASLEEAGSGADTISQNAAFQPSLTETGSGADTLGATADAVLSEAGSAADTANITATSTTLAETASAADTVRFAGEATATQTLIAGMYPGWQFP